MDPYKFSFGIHGVLLFKPLRGKTPIILNTYSVQKLHMLDSFDHCYCSW